MTTESPATNAAAAPTSGGTRTRVLTALAFGIPVVALVWWGPTWAVAILATVVMVFALNEFFILLVPSARSGVRTVGLVFGSLIVMWPVLEHYFFPIMEAAWFRRFMNDSGTVLELIAFMIGCFLLVLLPKHTHQKSLSTVGIGLAGLIYIAYPFCILVRMHEWDAFGGHLLMFLIAIIWVGDSAAYFAGRSIGKNKLAPRISPGKTWEGAIANIVASVLTAGCFGGLFLGAAGFSSFLAKQGALISIAGQIGDLGESALKRGAGVKDSGSILPGHGGILDRVDALIFAAPFFWYSFKTYWFLP